jgi:Phosphopantetheine attachment site/AMP-binding enzyme C-terminal domain
LYKTGDVARYRADGTIECMGRRDQQVKLRGFRIELEEISAVLGRHPEVRECVVVVREECADEKQLVAYVVAEGQSPPTAAVLRAYAKTVLPAYMVPTLFVPLPAFPRTPNGKVDRHALPTPDFKNSQLEESYVAPRVPLEETVARIWAEALKLEKVGVHDNFFEIGGHSLLIVQVQRRLSEALNHKMSVVDLFKHPTISLLVNFLNADNTAQLQVQDIEQRALRRRATQARRQRLANLVEKD